MQFSYNENKVKFGVGISYWNVYGLKIKDNLNLLFIFRWVKKNMEPAQYKTVFSAHFSCSISVHKLYNFVYYKKRSTCVCWRMKTLWKREEIYLKMWSIANSLPQGTWRTNHNCLSCMCSSENLLFAKPTFPFLLSRACEIWTPLAVNLFCCLANINSRAISLTVKL